jgi:hypothetical protein
MPQPCSNKRVNSDRLKAAGEGNPAGEHFAGLKRDFHIYNKAL